MRKPLIAANWKMYLTVPQAEELAATLFNNPIDFGQVDVMLAPSFTNLHAVDKIIKKAGVPAILAAQNVYTEDEGAYTGEVSIPMIESCGARAVILGHSERRHIFGESSKLVNAKVDKVLAAGMTAVVCVGELLEDRQAGVAVETVLAQLGASIYGVVNLESVVIAYEPVWAIGTGQTATPGDAQAIHEAIRDFLAHQYGDVVAAAVRILYGGSVKPDNIATLMYQQDIDGVLVGGASLKADEFLKIINYRA